MITKEEILNAAKECFSEKGYDRATMRDISQKLDISLGNLTYHFPRKYDLLEAITNECFQTLDIKREIDNLEDLDSLLWAMIASLQENRFYFISALSYTEDSEIAKEHHKRTTHLYQALTDAFQSLIERGYLKMDAAQCEACARTILITHIGWIQPGNNYASNISDKELARLNWQALIPYMTAKGRKEYQKLENR